MFYITMSSKASVNGRLFLAAIPDRETAASIFRLAGVLKHAHMFSGKLIAIDRLHVSLFFVGAMAKAEVRAFRLERVGELSVPPFEVSFDRTASFHGKPGSRPFVLIGGDGLGRLRSFRKDLASHLRREGLRRVANTNFEPHVTLLYDARSADEYPLGEPIAWTIKEIVLIHSLNGYEHVAKWRLVG